MWEQPHSETFRKMGAPEWRSINLVKYGVWVQPGRFPRTHAVLAALSDVRFLEVGLARMPPHTRIQPHSDNTNFVLGAQSDRPFISG